jgi:HPt (histidine-containing phosphotransfer) domain-containing protein
VDKVLADFVGDVPRLIAVLKEAVEADDHANVRLQAHTLKGASATVGAQALRLLSAQLEESSTAGSLENAASLMRDIEQSFIRFAETVKARGAPP